MLPGHLQEIYGTERVDFEVEQRDLARFVVRRLCRAVYDQIESLAGEEFVNGRTVSNINRGVREALANVFEAFQIPQRVSGSPKKDAPHIVVDSENIMPLAVKVLHRFRPDQAAAAGDQDFHVASLSKNATVEMQNGPRRAAPI
jgi:hypothetical protein